MQISTSRKHTSRCSSRSTAAHVFPFSEHMLLPPSPMTSPDASAWQAAAHLTSTYGYNSLAFFALDHNKQHFFSSTGKAFISYVVQGNVVVVIGDPIGPARELAFVLAEFLAFWRAQHKAVTFWQVREELLALYRQQGLHTLKMGEDAMIDVQNFTLKGGKMANVRSSYKRAEKDGMRALFYEEALPSAIYREQMARISHAWLARKGGGEMGFSMGRFEPTAQAGRLTALAVDQHEKVHAFVTFIPISGRNGWGLDLLRRSEQASYGTMELLLVRSLELFRARRASVVSLGLAPQSNYNQNHVSLLGRYGSLFLRHSRLLQHFQTLTAFKCKFQPTWENRYLVFSHPLQLCQIGLALHAVHRKR